MIRAYYVLGTNSKAPGVEVVKSCTEEDVQCVHMSEVVIKSGLLLGVITVVQVESWPCCSNASGI